MAERKTARLTEQLTRNLRSSGVQVVQTSRLGRMDDMQDQELALTFTLCPLYEVGPLANSRLIEPQAALSPTQVIEQSRVAAKWTTIVAALKSIHETASQSPFNHTTRAYVTFADRGVITADPERENPNAMTEHEIVYREALREAIGDWMEYQFRSYSDMDATFPRFIVNTDTQTVSREDDRALEIERAAGLVQRLRRSGVVFADQARLFEEQPASLDTQASRVNGNERRVIELVQQIGSVSLSEALMRQYATFDGQTSRKNSVNIFIERRSGDLLLKLTDLFPHRTDPRIDIVC